MTPENLEQNQGSSPAETLEHDLEMAEQFEPAQVTESAPEQKAESAPAPAEQPVQVRTVPAVAPTPRQMDELMARVEKILEEDLGDAYSKLSPIAKQEFKIKGEQTAGKIRQLMKSSTLKVKKVFKLILDWLKMLPGINRFFLEQEAKIKTDRLIDLHKTGY